MPFQSQLITQNFDLVEIPSWLLLLLVPALIVSQFILLKRKWIPHFISSLSPVLTLLLIPLVFTCESPIVFVTVTMQVFVVSLRLLDIAMVPRDVVLKWKIVDYAEYAFTFETKNSRMAHQDALKKKTSKSTAEPQFDNSVPFEKRDADYYGYLAVRIMALALSYNMSMKYIELLVDPASVATLSFTPLNAKAFMDQICIGVAIYSSYNIAYTIVYHLIAEVFQIAYQPCMNNPFISLGLQEFWSNRWNYPVKTSLKNAAFIPTMKFLKNSTGKPPSWHMVAASFSSFLLSAVIHEWLILALCNTPTYFEHLAFFLLHGLLTVLEVMMRKATRNIFGVDPYKCIPSHVIQIGTWFVMIWTANLFTAPLIRDGALVGSKFPIMFI